MKQAQHAADLEPAAALPSPEFLVELRARLNQLAGDTPARVMRLTDQRTHGEARIETPVPTESAPRSLVL